MDEKYFLQNNIKKYHMGIISRTSSLYEEGSEHFFNIPPEEVASTGENTSILLTNGLEGSLKEKEPHVIFLDEPGFGLSLGFQKVVAEYIVEYTKKSSEKLIGLMVIAHNIEIISEIAKTKPNHVRFGDERTLDEVLNKPYNLTKEDLLNLRTKSEETRHAIANIEEEIKTYNRTR